MKTEVLNQIKEKYDGADFKYHIIPVVKNALLLAEKVDANKEVVEMAAYLHDIGRSITKNNLKKFERENEHHIIGEKDSREFLKKWRYDKEFIEKVTHCVLTHRGRKGPEPKTIEAKIIACADAMAHFDTFLDLFETFLRTSKSFEEALTHIKEKMQRDWNKKLTLPEAKEIVKDKYEAIILLINSMEQYLK